MRTNRVRVTNGQGDRMADGICGGGNEKNRARVEPDDRLLAVSGSGEDPFYQEGPLRRRVEMTELMELVDELSVERRTEIEDGWRWRRGRRRGRREQNRQKRQQTVDAAQTNTANTANTANTTNATRPGCLRLHAPRPTCHRQPPRQTFSPSSCLSLPFSSPLLFSPPSLHRLSAHPSLIGRSSPTPSRA